jgi:hypothetical protein
VVWSATERRRGFSSSLAVSIRGGMPLPTEKMRSPVVSWPSVAETTRQVTVTVWGSGMPPISSSRTVAPSIRICPVTGDAPASVEATAKRPEPGTTGSVNVRVIAGGIAGSAAPFDGSDEERRA